MMLALLPLLLLVALDAQAPRTQKPAPSAPRDPFFTSTMTPDEIRGKQAVLETSDGTIVLDLLAEARAAAIKAQGMGPSKRPCSI